MNWLKKLFGCKLNPPTNLIEALDALDKMLAAGDKNIIRAVSSEETLATFHHSLGRQLRNDWGLWETKKSKLYHWFKSRGIWHADDMSSIIIKSFCRMTKGQPVRLQDQIQEYIEYWKTQREDQEHIEYWKT